MSDPDNPITIALRDMAEQAAPPHLRIDAAWRAGRRRRRAAVTTSVAGAAAAVAAAVLVPLALLGAPAHPAPGTFGHPPPPLPRLTYVMTINGKSVSFPRNGTTPSYHVHPGEHLLMTVAVTVPRHLRITALWLGISTGIWGNGPEGRPTGMHPILAHTRQPLSAGVHTFGLRWRIPEHPSGSSFFLGNAWTSSHPPAAVEGPIVELALH
jgi:hypothetical protein